MKKGAGEGWSCRFWLKACELFVYLNLRFRSYQFEEQVLSSQTFITCCGILKMRRKRMFLIARPQPRAVWQNGWHEDIQRIEQSGT